MFIPSRGASCTSVSITVLSTLRAIIESRTLFHLLQMQRLSISHRDLVVACGRFNQKSLVVYEMPTRTAVKHPLATNSIARVDDGEDHLTLLLFVT